LGFDELEELDMDFDLAEVDLDDLTMVNQQSELLREEVAQRAAALVVMPPRVMAAALAAMPPEERAVALAAMPREDRAAALAIMPPGQRAAALAAMSSCERAASLAAYEEYCELRRIQNHRNRQYGVRFLFFQWIERFLSADGLRLQSQSLIVRGTVRFALAAVQSNVHALTMIHPDLLLDPFKIRPVVLLAVKKDGRAMEDLEKPDEAPDEGHPLKFDPEVMLEAVRKDASVASDLPAFMQQNKAIMWQMANANPDALEVLNSPFLPGFLKNKGFAIKYVEQRGNYVEWHRPGGQTYSDALEGKNSEYYAGNPLTAPLANVGWQLRQDREVAEHAVRANGFNIAFVSSELANDPSIRQAAVEQNHAVKTLLEDLDFLGVGHNPMGTIFVPRFR